MLRYVIVTGLLAITSSAVAVPVDQNVYAPYTRKAYPKTFEAWGADGVNRIDGYRRKAAESAAINPRCDKVEAAELSDNRSQPPSQIVVFVDCVNGERFYMSGRELDNRSPSISQKQATTAISDTMASTACQNAVEAALRFPSSMDKAWFTTNVYRAPQGNVVVTFQFSAKSGFGSTLPQQARCVFDDRGMSPPEITNR